jgi:DNA-binding transcriptional regulator YiaG
MKFAVQLKAWRRRNKITQPQAAAVLEVPIDTLRGWEQKKHEPSPRTAAFFIEKFFQNGK